MNKKEFLEALRKALAVLDETELQDIIDEYEQHIDMKAASGLTEEEAIADFGDFKELTAELLDAYHVRVDYAEAQIPKNGSGPRTADTGGQARKAAAGEDGQSGEAKDSEGTGTSAAGRVAGAFTGLRNMTAGACRSLWHWTKAAAGWLWRIVKGAAGWTWKAVRWCWRLICRPFVWIAGLLGAGAGAALDGGEDPYGQDGDAEEAYERSGTRADPAGQADERTAWNVQADEKTSMNGLADEGTTRSGRLDERTVRNGQTEERTARNGQADSRGNRRAPAARRTVFPVRKKGGVYVEGRRSIWAEIGCGIAGFFRWCADVCVWCVRMAWNACCIGAAATVGMIGAGALFTFGMLVILMIGGYPLAGLVIAALGASCSLFAAAGLIMTLLWRKGKETAAAVPVPAPDMGGQPAYRRQTPEDGGAKEPERNDGEEAKEHA